MSSITKIMAIFLLLSLSQLTLAAVQYNSTTYVCAQDSECLRFGDYCCGAEVCTEVSEGVTTNVLYEFCMPKQLTGTWQNVQGVQCHVFCS